MSVIFTVVKKTNYKVDFCNRGCPFCKTVEDTSCCEDSFDEPNYDHYCTCDETDNSNTECEKYNNDNGKYIGTSLSRGGKQQIPKWCPFKKIDLIVI